MNKVYADNGSTSFPKAPGVSDAIKNFLDNNGTNINRGGYASSFDVALEVLETRKLLCRLFKFQEPRNVVFTPGITYSLNMLLHGFLEEGDHVITSAMEHNSVMRPLNMLLGYGVTLDVAHCRADGNLDPNEIRNRINKKTKAVVMTHASNVCGTVLPLEEVYEICEKNGVKLILDTAQTAGIIDINMAYVHALAFTCHKGLMAAQGLGGFILRNDTADDIKPIFTGGTGSKSHEITQPNFLPDKFESGTLNLPAIIGLKTSLEYILSEGIRAINEKEVKLTECFLSEMRECDEVEIIGVKGIRGRTGVVSLNFPGKDNAEIAAALDRDYGIMARCGLHCAPAAHKTLGTYPHGTVRFSFGYFNTLDEIGYIARAIRQLIKHDNAF